MGWPIRRGRPRQMGGAYNPRRANSSKRNRIIRLVRARQEPCHICGQDIDYSLPPDDPMAFSVDEVVPVSRWREGGYHSAEACALDITNCVAAHRICNMKRQNKSIDEFPNYGKASSVVNDSTLPLSREW